MQTWLCELCSFSPTHCPPVKESVRLRQGLPAHRSPTGESPSSPWLCPCGLSLSCPSSCNLLSSGADVWRSSADRWCWRETRPGRRGKELLAEHFQNLPLPLIRAHQQWLCPFLRGLSTFPSATCISFLLSHGHPSDSCLPRGPLVLSVSQPLSNQPPC